MSAAILTEPRRLDAGGDFVLPVPPADAFPMFDPVREAEWAEGWRIEAVCPRPFRLEADAVFEVPGPDGVVEVWTVLACDPAACRVEYLAVAGRDLVRRVTVQCDPVAGGSRVSVRYRVTAWTAVGAARAAGYNDTFIAEWRAPVLAALVRNGVA
ncbi:MAG: hypothetical protein WCQ64_02995 [Acidobacteriota bacterium]